MWKRKEIKKNAREVVSRNYWTAIIVCFLIALLTGEFGTSIVGIWQADDSIDPNYIINNEEIKENNEIVSEKFQNLKLPFDMTKLEKSLKDTQLQIFKIIEANLNSATKSQKYMFKIWDAVNFFNLRETRLGVTFFISALLAFVFTIFIANPLIVGGKRYFLKARKASRTKVGVMIDVFKNGNLLNVAITMFLRNIYNALWYITIVGGVVKTYEYRMIPYILAENPKIKRKEAFKLSKQMMKGNKWRAFILDMSFLMWNILSVLSFGILSILYVNPYNSATMAELYMILRGQAIKEKYDYYEDLNDKTLN